MTTPSGRNTDTPASRSAVPVTVALRGAVPAELRDYAADRIAEIAGEAHEPVLSASAVLTLYADPARERPAAAEATVDVNGTPVRAHVAGPEMSEAVDLLVHRLRRRLAQLGDRARTRHRWTGEAGAHEWRHGDVPTRQPEYFPRPPAERAVIRRKSFALQAQTTDEAAYDMDLLGHDFFLYTDRDTGHDAVIHRRPDGGYAVIGRVHPPPPADGATPITVEGSPPVLTEAQARERLDVAEERFVFFVEPVSGRGRVLYRRYDGHYGLITPA